MSKNWLAVASADHVAIGRDAGFMQVCHGKVSPLQRIQPGDRIVYYSPNRQFSASHALRGRDRLQAFTALGTVKAGERYRADASDHAGEGFLPWRRDVVWHEAQEIPLACLMGRLAFTLEANWGYRLRRGLVEIGVEDMTVIAEAMLKAAAEPDRLAA